MVTVFIPLLLLYNEYMQCTTTIDLQKPGYETDRIEYLLDYEYACNIEAIDC